MHNENVSLVVSNAIYLTSVKKRIVGRHILELDEQFLHDFHEVSLQIFLLHNNYA